MTDYCGPMKHETRPTPETDAEESKYGDGNAMHAHCHDSSHLSCDFADFARKLERERDEALQKAEIWAKQVEEAIRQVEASDALYRRQCEELARMQTMAASVADIIAKRDAMIEVIWEAHDALRNLILAKRGGMQPANALIDATSQANDAVKKLKPFLP